MLGFNLDSFSQNVTNHAQSAGHKAGTKMDRVMKQNKDMIIGSTVKAIAIGAIMTAGTGASLLLTLPLAIAFDIGSDILITGLISK